MSYQNRVIKYDFSEHEVVTPQMCEAIRPILEEKVTYNIIHPKPSYSEIHEVVGMSYIEGVTNEVSRTLSGQFPDTFGQFNKNKQDAISSLLVAEHHAMNVGHEWVKQQHFSSISEHAYQKVASAYKAGNIDTVNFKLCEGLKPISMLYTLTLGTKEELKERLAMYFKLGANFGDLTKEAEKIFFKESCSDFLTGYDREAHYPSDESRKTYKQCSLVAFGEEVEGQIPNNTRFAGKGFKQLLPYQEATNFYGAFRFNMEKEQKYLDSQSGFQWKDYIYVTAGATACVSVIGVTATLPISAPVTIPAFSVCAAVPAFDLSLDYLAITDRYFTSSFFISYKTLDYFGVGEYAYAIFFSGHHGIAAPNVPEPKQYDIGDYFPRSGGRPRKSGGDEPPLSARSDKSLVGSGLPPEVEKSLICGDYNSEVPPGGSYFSGVDNAFGAPPERTGFQTTVKKRPSTNKKAKKLIEDVNKNNRESYELYKSNKQKYDDFANDSQSKVSKGANVCAALVLSSFLKHGYDWTVDASYSVVDWACNSCLSKYGFEFSSPIEVVEHNYSTDM